MLRHPAPAAHHPTLGAVTCVSAVFYLNRVLCLVIGLLKAGLLFVPLCSVLRGSRLLDFGLLIVLVNSTHLYCDTFAAQNKLLNSLHRTVQQDQQLINDKYNEKDKTQNTQHTVQTYSKIPRATYNQQQRTWKGRRKLRLKLV